MRAQLVLVLLVVVAIHASVRQTVHWYEDSACTSYIDRGTSDVSRPCMKESFLFQDIDELQKDIKLVCSTEFQGSAWTYIRYNQSEGFGDCGTQILNQISGVGTACTRVQGTPIYMRADCSGSYGDGGVSNTYCDETSVSACRAHTTEGLCAANTTVGCHWCSATSKCSFASPVVAYCTAPDNTQPTGWGAFPRDDVSKCVQTACDYSNRDDRCSFLSPCETPPRATSPCVRCTTIIFTLCTPANMGNQTCLVQTSQVSGSLNGWGTQNVGGACPVAFQGFSAASTRGASVAVIALLLFGVLLKL